MKIASFKWVTLLILVEKIPPLDVLIVSEFIGAHPEFGMIILHKPDSDAVLIIAPKFLLSVILSKSRNIDDSFFTIKLSKS